MSNIDKLYEIQKFRHKILKQEELIQYYETMSHSLGGGGYEEKVQCTRNLDAPFVKWIYKKIDATTVLEEMKKQLNLKIDEVSNVVEQIENIDYRRILTYRYLLNQDWSTIASKLNLSISTVYRYHRKGLKDLEEVSAL